MPNRVLEVTGPESLPDAAISLLDNKELDLLVVRNFLLPSYLPRLNDLTKGINADVCPPIEEFGFAAAEALADTAKRAGEWVTRQEFENLEPLGEFIADRVKRLGSTPHIDRAIMGSPYQKGEYVSGPLVAIIGLRNKGLFAAKRSISVVDPDGKYDIEQHWQLFDSYKDKGLEYWINNRFDFSHVVYDQADLLMFTNAPVVTEHAGIPLSPRRKIAIYELGYKAPANAQRKEPIDHFASMLPGALQG